MFYCKVTFSYPTNMYIFMWQFTLLSVGQSQWLHVYSVCKLVLVMNVVEILFTWLLFERRSSTSVSNDIRCMNQHTLFKAYMVKLVRVSGLSIWPLTTILWQLKTNVSGFKRHMPSPNWLLNRVVCFIKMQK
jgi:hypothetical protein